MGKKPKAPEHENLERWLVSYADFITLLFATFVVLYALSQADLAKFKDVAQSIRAAFNPAKSVLENPGGVMPGTPDADILPDSGNSILDKILPQNSEGEQNKDALRELTESVQQINQEIAQLNHQSGAGSNAKETIGQSELKIQERGIVLSFASSMFFESGSAGLKPESFGALDKVALTLKGLNRVIHVEGHTDNIPISTAVYPSNWELSTARASSVVRYLIQKHKFKPQVLAAVGYAHSRPLRSNKTEEGRRKNRRVDVVILSSDITRTADAGLAQKGEKVIVRAKESATRGLGVEDKPISPIPAQDSASSPSSSSSATAKPAPEKPAEESPPGKSTKPPPINVVPGKFDIFDPKKQDKESDGKSDILKKVKFFR